jgi:hypothetical protein
VVQRSVPALYASFVARVPIPVAGVPPMTKSCLPITAPTGLRRAVGMARSVTQTLPGVYASLLATSPVGALKPPTAYSLLFTTAAAR